MSDGTMCLDDDASGCPQREVRTKIPGCLPQPDGRRHDVEHVGRASQCVSRCNEISQGNGIPLGPPGHANDTGPLRAKPP